MTNNATSKPNYKNQLINETLSSILNAFETDDIPQDLANIFYPQYNIPSAFRSLLNRFIDLKHHTTDSRGEGQWTKTGRTIKENTQPYRILGPIIKKVIKTDPKTKQSYEDTECTGFFPIKVFRVEDTEGPELEYEKLTITRYPLYEIAEQWGIKITGIGNNGLISGLYDPNNNEIKLATPEIQEFFLQLANAAIIKNLKEKKSKRKKNTTNESDIELTETETYLNKIIAELTAETLARIYKTELNTAKTFRNIRTYANQAKISPEVTIRNVLSRTETTLDLILNTKNEKNKQKPTREPYKNTKKTSKTK